ncbi:MAG: sigma-70 family RNA polymerase sigma factor [Oscillospiraceae bacterium]|nr:sigma-70 family RNA polymerase sigma factor [Oscillospiraceae bacterium]
MTYEDKKDWLNGYRRALRRQRALELEVERLQAEAERVTPLLTPALGRGGSGGGRLPMAVERIIESRQDLERQIFDCQRVRAQIMAAIATVPDERLQDVLRLKYISGLTYECIAEQLNCSDKWAKHLHRKAVEFLVVPL